MHDYLWHHTSQEKSKKADSESEVCPVVPILHNLQCIALEVYSSIKILFMESLHRYLAFAMIFCSIALLVKFEVMLHW